MRQRFATHVAGRAIADAVGRGEAEPLRRCGAVRVIAEAKMRGVVEFDFGNEACELAVLAQEIFNGSPGGAVVAGEGYLWRNSGNIGSEKCRGCRACVEWDCEG